MMRVQDRYRQMTSHGRGAALFLISCGFLATSSAWSAPIDLTGSPVAAVNDQPCVGTRAGTNLGCTAKEFTINTAFSAAPGTPPICVAGSSFDFLIDVQLSGSNANRYDISFYTGQTGNSPELNNASNLCSAAAFPMSLPSPWGNLDSNLNQCSDYISGGDSIVRVNRIKVQCQADANGYLSVPYTLAYEQNTGNPGCVAGTPSTYPIPTKSKCQSGTSSISGTVKVFSGAYVDVTKQTIPDGDTTAFSFSASGPSGSSVFAITPDGTYHPSMATAGVNAIPVSPDTITVKDGETVRFLINALTSSQTMTITESATSNWETTASISCSNVTGSPISDLDGNPATRTITASLNITNSAAACTITNTKRSRITLAKSVNGRADAADQFTVSASGGGTLTGTTSATTSGSGTTASTTFYSTPNTALTLNDTKAAGPTPLTGYLSSLTCTNAFTGPGATPNASLPNGLMTTNTSITPAPGDDITCSFTNARKVNLTLRKNWINALVNDAVNITATGLTTLSSTANTASEIDSGAVQYVRVGDVITFAETFASGTAANYTASLACTGTSGLSGSTRTIGSADTALICTYTNTFTGLPLLSILKSANSANANPGQTITYTVQITNTGVGSGANVVLTDNLSPYSAFGINTYGTGIPFSFTDAASGLSLGTPEYSNNNGSTWLYTPVSGGGGAPADYDGNVTNWRIPMTGTILPGGSFSLNYQIIVK